VHSNTLVALNVVDLHRNFCGACNNDYTFVCTSKHGVDSRLRASYVARGVCMHLNMRSPKSNSTQYSKFNFDIHIQSLECDES